MDWQPWVDDGVIAQDNSQRAEANQTVAAAWNMAVDARRALQAGDLPAADARLRECFLKAACALVQSEGYAPATNCTFELARKASEAYFGPTIAGDLFSSVDALDADGASDHKAVKRGVTACATFAAVVGSRIDL